MTQSTEQLYDRSADSWRRDAPVLLSDFTARPFLLDWCEPVRGYAVLDLGCGEGYVARQLESRGAGSVVGIDVSAEMIAEAEAHACKAIEYRVGDARAISDLPAASFDLVVAVFLFNYLDAAETAAVMRDVERVLRPGGRFVFAVPHPSLPFSRPEEPPFFFERDGAGYFSGRDRQLEGTIWRRDGVSVPVRCVHKTLGDYFEGLREAGFRAIPEVRELGVTADHVELDPVFFGPLEDQPLHLAFRVTKTGGQP